MQHSTIMVPSPIAEATVHDTAVKPTKAHQAGTQYTPHPSPSGPGPTAPKIYSSCWY